MRAALALVLALAAGAAAAETPVLTFRTKAQVLEVGAGAIMAVRVTEDTGGGAAIDLVLDLGFARAFGDMTEAAVGQVMQVMVCGEMVVAPRMMERIAGGRVLISGPGVETAMRHIRVLEGVEPCP